MFSSVLDLQSNLHPHAAQDHRFAVHFQVLVPDGVFVGTGAGAPAEFQG